ncbi:MAG: DUF4157 domain-containing protein [Myxococcales bacterium]|nr:DUF4157 domain-containing protein [Myxococcales bacterium]
MRQRHAPKVPGPVARKAAAGKRPRVMDRSLERQAEEATQAALHGQVNVARMLTPAPAAKAELPASVGRPLPTELRADAERAFGAELGAVRLHTDAAAAHAAVGHEARAFTAGRSIFFAEGQYQPGTDAGRELVYHEVAHVLQQTGRRLSTTEVVATDREGSGPPQREQEKRHG